MKPELKAILEACTNVQRRFVAKDQPMMMTRAVFLSALHWRGDELWCGPIRAGMVLRIDTGQWFYDDQLVVTNEKVERMFATEAEARAALEAAAREQISKWF